MSTCVLLFFSFLFWFGAQLLRLSVACDCFRVRWVRATDSSCEMFDLLSSSAVRLYQKMTAEMHERRTVIQLLLSASVTKIYLRRAYFICIIRH